MFQTLIRKKTIWHIIKETQNPDQDKMENLWRWISKILGEMLDINYFIGDASININGKFFNTWVILKGHNLSPSNLRYTMLLRIYSFWPTLKSWKMCLNFIICCYKLLCFAFFAISWPSSAKVNVKNNIMKIY